MTEELAISNPVWFGNRLNEIMDSKIDDRKITGKQLKAEKTKLIEGLSKRLFVSSRTMYRILEGSKSISKDDLKAIAKYLSIDERRLLQQDHTELLRLYEEAVSQKDQNRSMWIAKEMLAIAIGLTERYECLKIVGNEYKKRMDFIMAQKYWKDAYECAIKLGDHDRLFSICNSLMFVAVKRGKYALVDSILSEAETYFSENDEKLARIKIFRGIADVELDEVDLAVNHFKAAIEIARNSGSIILLSDAEHNLGELYFRNGDFLLAKQHFENAVGHLSMASKSSRIYTQVDLAKTHIKLNDQLSAMHVINQGLVELEKVDNSEESDVKGKLLVLLAELTRSPEPAKQALELELSDQTKFKALTFLHDYFLRCGDASEALYYHESILDMGVRKS